MNNTKEELNDSESTSSGIMEELLKSPLVKQILRENLNSLNEEEAKELVKTALWTDPELTLSSLAVIPTLVNGFSAALLEADKELEEKVSDEFLSSYLEQLFSQVNTENFSKILNRTATRTKTVVKAASIKEDEILQFMKEPLAIQMGESINSFIQYINTVQKNENGYFSEMASNIFSQIDKEELNKAVSSITKAFISHIPDVFQWTSKALGDNLLGRFGIKF